ncbi:hypothetical protein ACUV84_000170 [Puccinellia chinampoensis]
MDTLASSPEQEGGAPATSVKKLAVSVSDKPDPITKSALPGPGIATNPVVISAPESSSAALFIEEEDGEIRADIGPTQFGKP